jgi:hypothetical protein
MKFDISVKLRGMICREIQNLIKIGQKHRGGGFYVKSKVGLIVAGDTNPPQKHFWAAFSILYC